MSLHATVGSHTIGKHSGIVSFEQGFHKWLHTRWIERAQITGAIPKHVVVGEVVLPCGHLSVETPTQLGCTESQSACNGPPTLLTK